MMPPLPILLAAIILLGYPLIQIAAIRIRRPWRMRFNALAREILADPALTEAGRERVEYLHLASKGRPEIESARRFIVMPFRVFSFEMKPPPETEAKPTSARVARMHELHELAMNLEWASWPIAFMLMISACTVSMVTASLVARLRGTNANARPRMSDIRRAATLEPDCLPIAA